MSERERERERHRSRDRDRPAHRREKERDSRDRDPYYSKRDGERFRRERDNRDRDNEERHENYKSRRDNDRYHDHGRDSDNRETYRRENDEVIKGRYPPTVDKPSKRLEVSSTGHKGGIHTAESFGDKEREMKQLRDKKLAEMNETADQTQETVYRDKRGRKLDMLTEFMRQQEAAEGKRQKIEQAQYEWGKGAVQKQAAEDKIKELEEIANEPFARTIDDPKLEKIKKSIIRDGDPMAEYFSKKERKKQIDPELGIVVSKTGKPLYSGPNPTPNRFGLRPGYRWDAVDRGNGFEQRILTKQSEKMGYKDEEYKYSVSDL